MPSKDEIFIVLSMNLISLCMLWPTIIRSGSDRSDVKKAMNAGYVSRAIKSMRKTWFCAAI